MTIKTLSSKVVYQNPWMTVREDDIQRESGAKGIYGVVDKLIVRLSSRSKMSEFI